MTKKEKENNFLQIYYYRRASACYPYKIDKKKKKHASWLKNFFKRKKQNG